MNNRREFVVSSVAALASLTTSPAQTKIAASSDNMPLTSLASNEDRMTDKAEDPRITRARLSGPEHVTKHATIAEMGSGGVMTVLLKGTNEWVCVPGDEDKIGAPPMCMNPLGMQWMLDAMQGKSAPTNTAPGVIYMLYGATQRSNTVPSDRTSPAIPIGPHWMITWPFDAEAIGLPTTVRDKGAWVMFAGTPFAYLHVCGTPWEGNEYREGDKAIWTMEYSRPRASA